MIDKQTKFFKDNKDMLLKKYDGRYIVIDEDLSISDFSTLEEAYDFGTEKYGLGNFFLKGCELASADEVDVISPEITLI